MTTVLIAGAGIGGLTAAIALRQRGFRPVVVERASELKPVGAGLLVQPNALRALGTLGLLEAVRAAGMPIRHGDLRGASGRVLSRLELGELSPDLGGYGVAIHRARLHQVLVAACGPGVLRLGSAVERIEASERGVIVHAAGERLEGDLLIGADGLHSAVRRHLFGEEALRYSGQTSWRAIVRTREVLGADENCETLGVGQRFGYARVSPEEVYCYAVESAAAGGRDEPGTVKERLQARFGGWHAPIPSLIAAMDEAQVVRTDLFDRPPRRSWGQGRITLLGDAAHPMTPNLGQGACHAIEDAVVLADALGSAADPAGGLRAYEQRRIGRANRFVRDSRRAGLLLHAESRAAAALRDALLWATPDALAIQPMRRLARFRVL